MRFFLYHVHLSLSFSLRVLNIKLWSSYFVYSSFQNFSAFCFEDLLWILPLVFTIFNLRNCQKIRRILLTLLLILFFVFFINHNFELMPTFAHIKNVDGRPFYLRGLGSKIKRSSLFRLRSKRLKKRAVVTVPFIGSLSKSGWRLEFIRWTLSGIVKHWWIIDIFLGMNLVKLWYWLILLGKMKRLPWSLRRNVHTSFVYFWKRRRVFFFINSVTGNRQLFLCFEFMLSSGSSKILCWVEIRIFHAETFKKHTFFLLLPGQCHFINLKYFINLDKILYPLEYLYETALVTKCKFLHLAKKYFWQIGYLTMFFRHAQQLEYELPTANDTAGLFLAIVIEILMDPNFPLTAIADRDHFFPGLEGAKDIDESIISYHHFFEKVKNLRER